MLSITKKPVLSLRGFAVIGGFSMAFCNGLVKNADTMHTYMESELGLGSIKRVDEAEYCINSLARMAGRRESFPDGPAKIIHHGMGVHDSDLTSLTSGDYLISLDKNERTLLINFRGTKGKTDSIHDGEGVIELGIERFVEDAYTMSFHSGFVNSLLISGKDMLSHKDTIVNSVKKELTKEEETDYNATVVIGGHSLGGAKAGIALLGLQAYKRTLFKSDPSSKHNSWPFQHRNEICSAIGGLLGECLPQPQLQNDKFYSVMKGLYEMFAESLNLPKNTTNINFRGHLFAPAPFMRINSGKFFLLGWTSAVEKIQNAPKSVILKEFKNSDIFYYHYANDPVPRLQGKVANLMHPQPKKAFVYSKWGDSDKERESLKNDPININKSEWKCYGTGFLTLIKASCHITTYQIWAEIFKKNHVNAIVNV